MKRSSRLVVFSLLAAALSTSGSAETYVLPVVVGKIGGAAGSVWESELRIMRLDPTMPVTVRRLWVATEAGGALDAPLTAPTWDFPAVGAEAASTRMIIVGGWELLQGSGQPRGAVALEIEGPVSVMLRISDTQNQRPPLSPGDILCCFPGSGQLLRATASAISGPSFIPWVTSTRPEDSAHPALFRTNVGLLNPSGEPMSFVVSAVPLTGFGTQWLSEGKHRFAPDLTVTLPPLGWTQLNDIFAGMLVCDEYGCSSPGGPFPAYVTITPVNPSSEYYAYASMIFTPKNDPEFIWAEPGDLGGASQP